MKLFTLITLSLWVLFSGCSIPARPGSYSGTTGISVSGASGDLVAGFYVQDGQRFSFSNTVPWSAEVPALSSLTIYAPESGGEAVVDLRYEAEGISVRTQQALGSGVRGMRVRVQNGFVVQPF